MTKPVSCPVAARALIPLMAGLVAGLVWSLPAWAAWATPSSPPYQPLSPFTTGLGVGSGLELGQFTRLTLTISKVGQGEISRNPQPGLSDSKYPSGITVRLAATPAYGWYFDSWSGDVTSASPNIVVVMDSDKKVIANFKAKYAALTSLAEDARSRVEGLLTKRAALEEELRRLETPRQSVDRGGSSTRRLGSWKQDSGLFVISLSFLFALGGLVSSLLFLKMIWRGKAGRARR